MKAEPLTREELASIDNMKIVFDLIHGSNWSMISNDDVRKVLRLLATVKSLRDRLAEVEDLASRLMHEVMAVGWSESHVYGNLDVDQMEADFKALELKEIPFP